MGDRRLETGDGRREEGDRRKQIGDRRGFSDVKSKKICTYNLVAEFITFKRMLITNLKYKLEVVANSAKWGKTNCNFPLNKKLSGFNRLVSNYAPPSPSPCVSAEN